MSKIRCSICAHKETAAITKALADGGSRRDVAAQFSVGASSLNRHRQFCLKMPFKHKTPNAPKKKPATVGPALVVGDAVRFGLDGSVAEPTPIRFDPNDPQALIVTTARLVDEALDLVAHAKRDGDKRIVLAALGQAREGLQLLLRAAGRLSPDNATTINIDARRQQALLLDSALSVEECRALLLGLPLPPEAVSLASGDVIDAKSIEVQ